MNQKKRQNAKNSIEKGFYKLLNNANNGHDCRSNLDNCDFELIVGNINEITYTKKYHNLFDKKNFRFCKFRFNWEKIEENYTEKLKQIKKD